MKTCTLCQEEKAASSFNRKKSSKDGRQNICRECSKKYFKLHYRGHKKEMRAKIEDRKITMREWFAEFKSGLKCVVCGEQETCCLEFHHNDPQEKEFELGMAATAGYGRGRILAEIAKCTVLCANCHRKVHAGVLQLDATVV